MDSSSSPAAPARDLAAAEKRAARRMNLGGSVVALAIAAAIVIVSLALPYAGDIQGYEVGLRSDSQTTIAEQLYVVFITVGVGILTPAVIITRLAPIGLIAWMVTTVAIPLSMFSLWIRQTRPDGEDGMDTSVGVYVSIVGVIVAFGSYCMVALRRDASQQEIQEQRREASSEDVIGRTQREAGETQPGKTDSNHPLFVDDRRRQASRRHRPG